MFCYFQFLNKDPARRLGSDGESRAIREHPFFETVDWMAVEERRMARPREKFKVVSDTFISCCKLKLKLHVTLYVTVL